jgi:hypothetical protein
VLQLKGGNALFKLMFEGFTVAAWIPCDKLPLPTTSLLVYNWIAISEVPALTKSEAQHRTHLAWPMINSVHKSIGRSESPCHPEVLAAGGRTHPIPTPVPLRWCSALSTSGLMYTSPQQCPKRDTNTETVEKQLAAIVISRHGRTSSRLGTVAVEADASCFSSSDVGGPTDIKVR